MFGLIGKWIIVREVHDDGTATTIDQRGSMDRITTLINRTGGIIPANNEKWYVDRLIENRWTFVARAGPPAAGVPTSAAVVTFDDTGNVSVLGAHVQEALDATDAALVALDAATEKLAHKNAVNGYPGLDSNARILPARLGTGASASTFLRGDQTFQALAESDVTSLVTDLAARLLTAGHTAKSLPVSDTGALADLVMGASTMLARLAAGGIIAATPAQIKTLLALVAADISNFDTQVRTSRLDQMAAPTTAVPYLRFNCTSTTRPGSPADGQVIYETDTKLELIFNGTAWVCRTPIYANVATYATRAIASYGDLSSGAVGPAISIQTAAKALVTFGAEMYQTTGGTLGTMSIAVSGATTVAAIDGNALTQSDANSGHNLSRTVLFSGLTPGVNTFTCKYKGGAGVLNAGDRDLTVVGIP